MKNIIFLISIAASSLVSFNILAEQDISQSNQQQEEQQEPQPFSEAELAQMLAPIALYPDSLLTHILIAATYPIEIVEAHRWLIKNEELSTEQAADEVNAFNWDASVKALVPFGRILSRLSEDLTWTQQLGDAFLQDESRLLNSIQELRKQAELAGNLEKMENMEVSYEKSNIVIEPVVRETVYVPYYDTRMVYGNWHWASYPPVYWKPRHSVYVSHYNPFYWHSGINISFNYFFSAFHWHNRHVVVVNSHRTKYRYYDQRPKRLIANGGYAKRWSHKPTHRKGVAYRTKHTSAKYNKQVKVRANSHKLHRVVEKKMQRHSNDRLSMVKHKTTKSLKNKAVLVNKNAKKTAHRKYAAIDKSKVNTKKFSTEKAYRSKSYVNKGNVNKGNVNKVISKKVSPKTYKRTVAKSSTKSYKSAPSKKHYSANKKQSHKPSHRSKSVKTRHSKPVKGRDK